MESESKGVTWKGDRRGLHGKRMERGYIIEQECDDYFCIESDVLTISFHQNN